MHPSELDKVHAYLNRSWSRPSNLPGLGPNLDQVLSSLCELADRGLGQAPGIAPSFFFALLSYATLWAHVLAAQRPLLLVQQGVEYGNSVSRRCLR